VSLVRYSPKNHPQQVRRGGDPVTDDRALPAAVFEELIQSRFRLTIDAAASAENAKLPRYWTAADDALTQDWSGERIYCNPPYSDIATWIRKAWQEVNAEIIVMLLPANRTEQQWWHELVEPRRDRPGSPLRAEFVRGRLRFMRPGETKPRPNSRPPFGSLLLIWDRAPAEKVDDLREADVGVRA
jgi:phage N-6-adenine-methyltransferase